MNKNEKKAFILKVEKRLRKKYYDQLKTSLDFSTPWQLLVATILSAQSQDKQVNIITKKLFNDYPHASNYVSLKPAMLYPYIKHVGLYRNKAKNIIKAAQHIKQMHYRLPRNIHDMVNIPGVGRKSANVVLHNGYGISEGIAIDTHCITVANRLGLARTKNPHIIERNMMEILDNKYWNDISHLFIALGRDTCKARIKECERCVLQHICPSSDAKNK